MRRFHSYGPVDASRHFAVERRALVERCVDQLVGDPDEGGQFFTLWAPRQVGKTCLERRAIDEIRARHGERFTVGALSVEAVADEAGFFRSVPEMFRVGFGVEPAAPADWSGWRRLFARGGGLFDGPLILLVDEVDLLPPAVVERLVRELRSMYLDRGAFVLHGLALIGVRAVLGVESAEGSLFNVQRSLRVPNLTRDEVVDMFGQYQAESGQAIAPEVVEQVHAVTRGQPGLVGWFGELLTERYNHDPEAPIGLAQWEDVYGAAVQVEPNNTVLDLIGKARGPHRERVRAILVGPDVPFAFDDAACNFLYLNGIIDHEKTTGADGRPLRVCRFSSPFVPERIHNALASDPPPARDDGTAPPVVKAKAKAPRPGRLPLSRGRRRALALAFGILVSLLGIGLLELTCGALNGRAPKIVREKGITHDTWKIDPVLGYKPAPGIDVRSVLRRNGAVLYDVGYTIDDRSRRVTPFADGPERVRPVLFFGDSFTFGEGVEGDETVPADVARLVSWARPYNYGFSGYGPQEMLAKLQAGVADEIEGAAPIAVYTYLDFHIQRAIGSVKMGSRLAYYALEGDGKLVRHGDFTTGRPVTAALYGLLGKSEAFKYFKADFPPIADRHIVTTFRIIEESRNAFMKAFPEGRFYVLVYPGWPKPYRLRRMTGLLAKAGIEVLDLHELPARTAPGAWFEGDGHPTARTDAAVAEKLAAFLEERCGPGR